jgi:hypothetical protein
LWEVSSNEGSSLVWVIIDLLPNLDYGDILF